MPLSLLQVALTGQWVRYDSDVQRITREGIYSTS